MLSRVKKKLNSKPYRSTFSRSRAAAVRAAQITAMRHSRGWSQAELAEISGMKQSRISLLEDPSYEAVNIETLHRLADAFDVAVLSEFASFGKLLEAASDSTAASMNPESFAHDPAFSSSTPLPVVLQELLRSDSNSLSETVRGSTSQYNRPAAVLDPLSETMSRKPSAEGFARWS